MLLGTYIAMKIARDGAAISVEHGDNSTFLMAGSITGSTLDWCSQVYGGRRAAGPVQYRGALNEPLHPYLVDFLRRFRALIPKNQRQTP